MKRSGIAAFLTLIALTSLAMLIASCSERGTPADSEAVELKSYPVPPGYDADQIRNYIRGSLERGDTVYGSVVKYPDGSLVVTAPPSIQTGVAELMRELSKRPPASPVSDGAKSVSVRYWVLLGRSLSSGKGVSFATESLRHATDLVPVLEAVVGSQGAQEFALVERLRLVSSIGGQPARIRGRHAAVEQRLMQQGEAGPVADIEIRTMDSRGAQTHDLSTRVSLEPDRFVVLGQAAYNAPKEQLPAGWDAGDVYLYFVIAAAIE